MGERKLYVLRASIESHLGSSCGSAKPHLPIKMTTCQGNERSRPDALGIYHFQESF
jgi:hypothetical protein